MPGILLTWNPTKWNWRNQRQQIRQVATRGYVDEPWSVGTRKNIPVGTRTFLIMLGPGLTREQKGLIASGFTTSTPVTDLHWDDDQAVSGVETSYVKVRFDTLVLSPIISLDELDYRFGPMTWTPQRSGNDISDRILDRLEAEWRRRIEPAGVHRYPVDVGPAEIYYEGSVQRIVVNRYERDPAARAACIEQHGDACAVCELSFEELYGPIAAGFIQVHHVVPLSQIRSDHSVNPLTDLIPVCPNCHAVIHMRIPALSIKEARNLVRQAT